jgi:hypothetical protein
MWRIAVMCGGSMANHHPLDTTTHGLTNAFARSGGADDMALTDPQRGRLAELRAELTTSAGVIDALRERAARMVLIAEWGESWLQQKAEDEGGIAAFEAKMLQRFFTAQAEARRSLEALIKAQGRGDGGINADDVLKAIRNDKQGE